MLAHGTTTFEAKTGYGLSREGELRLVSLARQLRPAAVTGLFAHAVPPGYDAAGWMDEVDRLATDAAVDALDIYVESVAFRNEDLERLGEIARREEVPLRAHVEQFNANRSVPVALAAGARSVDHLACLHPDDIAPLAAAECAAVLLPGAEFLGAEQTAPGRALADAGAICVLATDCNPGTSPVASLPVVIGLAVRRYGWSAREALAACTLNAAWVLGMLRPDRVDRGGQAGRPRGARRAGRAHPVPVRAQPGARGDRRRGGRVAASVIAAERPRRAARRPDPDRLRRRRAARRGSPGRARTRRRRAGSRAARRRSGGGWSATPRATCGPARHAPGPWWAAGSHLDSVRSGGRFDGALGVAAAFAVAERSSVPLAVISFADEEGARFNTPTFGSRALVGRLDVDDAVERVDEHGIALADAMADAGVDAAGLARAPQWLERLRGFLELHVDQTRDVAAAAPPGRRGHAAGRAAAPAGRARRAAPTTPARPRARSATTRSPPPRG